MYIAYFIKLRKNKSANHKKAIKLPSMSTESSYLSELVKNSLKHCLKC